MEYYYTPLHYAIKHGEEDVAKYFIVECKAHVDEKMLRVYVAQVGVIEELYWTGLHCAAFDGNIKMMQLLVDKGAAIEARTVRDKQHKDEGHTPVMLAALSNRPEAISVLAEKGADLGAITSQKQTALMIAAEKNNEAAALRLLALHGVGNKDTALQAQDSDEMTALHYAAYKGNIPLIVSLLAAGANINAEALEGDTPMMVAADNNDAAVISVLAENGADLTGQRRSILQTVVGKNNEAAVRKLLSLGADYGALNKVLLNSTHSVSEGVRAAIAKAERADALYNGDIGGIHDIDKERFRYLCKHRGVSEQLAAIMELDTSEAALRLKTLLPSISHREQVGINPQQGYVKRIESAPASLHGYGVRG